MSVLTHALASLDAARPTYTEAEAFYVGNATETFSNPQLQHALGSSSPDFAFNYARLVIQSRLSRMEVSSVTTQDGSADDLLATIWVENQLDQELQDAFEASLVFGDAYLIAESTEDSFDVFYNSPYDTRVFYSPENPRVKSYAVKRWLNDDGKLRVNLYFSDRTERWVSKSKATATYQDGDFEPYVEDAEVWPAPNETGEIPVFHLRTGRMYGTPEHAQAYGPQRAITKLLGSQMDSIDYQTGPQRYMIQDAKASNTASTVANSAFGDVDEDDLEPAGLTSSPNGIWNLKGVSSVGQFDPANPEVFVTPFKTFIEATATVTGTPMHAFNVGSLPSGESLRAAEAPLNKRVEQLERLFGGVIADLHEYALSTFGIESDVIVTWSPAATYDDSDVWATVKAKTDAGVPMRVALMEAGYTDAQVTEWYPDSDVTHRSIEDLARLGEALQKLSAAVTLGVITKEEARSALPQDILTQLPTVDPESVIEAVNNSFIEE